MDVVDQLKEAAIFCDSITDAYITCTLYPHGWRIRVLEVSPRTERFEFGRTFGWDEWAQSPFTLKQLAEQTYAQYQSKLQIELQQAQWRTT